VLNMRNFDGRWTTQKNSLSPLAGRGDQARDIPVFGRAGNFNSLFVRKSPCSAA
jgi:hypothetical protein